VKKPDQDQADDTRDGDKTPDFTQVLRQLLKTPPKPQRSVKHPRKARKPS